MKRLLLLLAPFVLLAGSLSAAMDPVLDAVRSADDARVAATVAASKEQLSAVFSDDLVYTHSSGAVNDKAALIGAIVSGKTQYFSFDYESRDFVAITPNIVLMRGRCTIHSANSGQKVDNYLAYLGVWRLENGAWRFVAWQSCHLPPAKH
ncbi:MAG TPA: nuclear transport factor 2 family protein [Opitutaceae bacterium]|nr:nuclear transport factor 2 family protein [Opitutaceae bacterium]